jgi:hypothetical protein
LGNLGIEGFGDSGIEELGDLVIGELRNSGIQGFKYEPIRSIEYLQFLNYLSKTIGRKKKLVDCHNISPPGNGTPNFQISLFI